MRAVRRQLLLAAFASAALLVGATSAQAHALLESTVPARDAALTSAPGQVELNFSEPIEAAFGAVRVYDEKGIRIDRGGSFRPNGESSLGVRLADRTVEGAFTVTYRVVSADSHPVAGGFVFRVGDAEIAPTRSIASYLAGEQAPQGVRTAYTVVRFAGYLALCLLFGFVFFDAFVFGRAVREIGLTAADAPFARRALRYEGTGVALGVASSALAIGFQAAISAGSGLAAALESGALSEVMDTRSGGWMFTRLGIWIAIAAIWGISVRRSARTALAPLLAMGAIAAQTPALIGHAAVTQPTWLMLGIDLVHVVAMCVWVGGLIALVVALPSATRILAEPDRTKLLAKSIGRFSNFALACVVALVVSGLVQSLVHFSSPSELFSTAYGRAIAIKSGLLVFVVLVAAYVRMHVLPALDRRADSRESPGHAGRTLRRALTFEVVLTVCAVVAASALVGYPPAKAATSGPVVTEHVLGAAQMQLIVDPARSGANQVHLYLTSPRDGRQFTDFDDLSVAISRADGEIGPIDLKLRRAGPGHFVVPDVRFPGGGAWKVVVAMRHGEFDQWQQTIPVDVR